MANANKYKNFEDNLVQRIKDLGFLLGEGLIFLFRGLFRILTRRYTILLVPDSEKKIYNLHITIAGFLFSICLLIGGIGFAFFYGTSRGFVSHTRFSNRDVRLQETLVNLDQFRDETATLLREAYSFENALSTTLSALGKDVTNQNANLSFLNNEGMLPEVNDIRRVSGYFSTVSEPIREIGVLLNSQSALLAEIPSIWPVAGGLGQITMSFGQNINPFTGQYYIHKGIDISTNRQGDPIVATADGQVVTVDYDSNLGNHVLIRHRHGFYTRYAHMLSMSVRNGQRIQQGEVIGYIGNTGLSTGPHLHYEVYIGSDVVDPYKYITIRSNIARSR